MQSTHTPSPSFWNKQIKYVKRENTVEAVLFKYRNSFKPQKRDNEESQRKNILGE